MSNFPEHRQVSRTKILVIGLDGASFDYINPLIEAGRLPTLAKLKQNGAWGQLVSITPPQTPAAWASFRTGTGPGKHGIFGWWKVMTRGSKSPILTPFTRTDIQGKPIWKLISDYGMSVGVINVPMTYPPEEVNGFVIAGFDNPFKKPEFEDSIAHPKGLMDDIRMAIGDYRIIEPFEAGRWSGFSEMLASWKKMETSRTSAALCLLNRFHPDFLMIVFHITDYFSHRAGRDQTFVHDAYECVDQQIRRLLDVQDQDTTVLVVSDHGAAKVTHFIYIHNWLEEQGLIRYHNKLANEQVEPLLTRVLRTSPMRLSSERAQFVIRLISRTYLHLPEIVKRIMFPGIRRRFPGCNKSFGNINWSQTKAFCISDYGHISINRRDRGPQGIVEDGPEYEAVKNRIKEGLRNLVDPVSGKRIVNSAKDSEEVYTGPFSRSGPDIILEPTHYCYYFLQSYKYYLTEQAVVREISQIIDQPEHSYFADHHPDGVLIAVGSGVPHNLKLNTSRLIDIAPTILARLGIAIPPEMDGKILHEISGVPQSATERLAEQESISPETQEERLDEHALAEELRRKLRLLGYRV